MNMRSNAPDMSGPQFMPANSHLGGLLVLQLIGQPARPTASPAIANGATNGAKPMNADHALNLRSAARRVAMRPSIFGSRTGAGRTAAPGLAAAPCGAGATRSLNVRSRSMPGTSAFTRSSQR
ncbi:hypothetical protein D3C83_08780 [compost metagenome]